MACAVQRRRFPVGENPTRQSLQPEAIGAVMEVTKWLKPSISVSRIGDSASVQAATRMGLLKSSIYFTPLSTSSIPVSLFDLESRFFAPPHTRVEADAHRACQGRPSLCLAARSVVSRPRALTGPSTAATLVVVGTMIRG